MTPNEELRLELRELLDEVIPEGGTESDTRFTDAQIDALLKAANDINQAASNGWSRKALKAMSERGGLQESQAESEKFKFITLESYRDHCLQMARMFYELVPGLGGSRLFALDSPDVLGLKEVK